MNIYNQEISLLTRVFMSFWNDWTFCGAQIKECWQKYANNFNFPFFLEKKIKDFKINIYLPISSSSLKGFISAISSEGTVKPVKEKDKPKLALEARLRAAPLLTSSRSNFNWALLDFLMCVLFLPPPLRPGDAPVNRLLDFLDNVSGPPPPPATSPFIGDDFVPPPIAAEIASTNWSDFVRSKLVVLGLSIIFFSPLVKR